MTVGTRWLRFVVVAALLAAGCDGPGPTFGAAVPSAAPPSPAASCTEQGVLATWSLPRLVRQTLVIPVNQSNVDSIRTLVADGAGGVILFGARAPAGLTDSLARLVATAPDGIAPLVMTDEEGGAVQRLPNIVGTIPSARRMAATMSPAEIERLARQVGGKLKATGVTMDLAPVLDLDDGPGPSKTNPAGTRSFSPVPATASAAGIAFANGLRAAGVVPVVKHFPGLGGATGNTDNVAATTLPWSTLQRGGLLPFTDAVRAGLPAVMVANASVPGLTTKPASVSHEVITTVLRGQLRFSGLVMTDTLSSVAIRSAGYSVPGATVAALRAGADMVLFNTTASAVAALTRQVVQAVVAAVGTGALPRERLEDAVRHVLSAKRVNLCGP